MKSVTIIFICALAFGLSFLACDPKAKKIEAFNELISTTTFEDTVITYSLFSDSVILRFAKKPKINQWYGEIFLIKLDPEYAEQVIPFPDKSREGWMGNLEIKTTKLTFSGFHIPSDSLPFYSVRLHVVPHIPGFSGKSGIYAPMYLFSSKPSGSNKLEVNKNVKDFRITLFDLVKLRNMSPRMREFCRDSIYNGFSTYISDQEIEESEYAF